jgi:hypothetical protein
MARRGTRWSFLIAAVIMLAGAVFVLLKPELLAPAATRLINRQLAQHDGHLRVGAYRLRAMNGLDATDVTLTLRGQQGGLTLVAIDVLEVDFRLREILSRTPSLRRVSAQGVEVYHHQRPPAVRPDQARATRALPELEIASLAVRDGRIEISGSDGRLRERIDGLTWFGELASDGRQARLVTRSGAFAWPSRNAVLSSIYGLVTLTDDGTISAEDLAAVWNDGRATVSGHIGPERIELQASGRNVTVDELNDLTGLDLDFAAHGDIDCTVTAANDTVRFAGDFTGRFEDWDLREVRAEAVIAGNLGDFQVMRGQVGGAWFDGTLQVDERGGQSAVITLAGEARDLDLRAGLIPGADPDDLPHTGGHGWLEIVHTTADDATRVRGRLTDGFIEIMPFDRGEVDVWARGDSLHFHTIDLRHGQVRVQLVGASDRHEVFRGRLQVTADDLADLPSNWGWPRLAGRCTGVVTVQGPLDDLGVAGSLTFLDLAGPAVAAAAGQVSLVGERVLGDDWVLSAAVEGDGFRLGNVPLGRYTTWLRVDKAMVALDAFRTVLGDTLVALRGRADLAPDQTDVRIEQLYIALGGNDWRTDEAVTASVGPGFVRIPGLRLLSDLGELSAEVDYDRPREVLDGRLHLVNVNLDLLDTVLDWPQRTGARVTAQLELGGRPADPDVNLRGVLRQGSFPLAHVDSLRVDATLRAGTVRLDTLVMGSEYGKIDLHGSVAHPGAGFREFWPGAALDLQVTINDGDWAFLEQFELEALDRLAGRVQGRLLVQGDTRDPVITGDLDSVDFQFHWLRLEQLTGTVRADATQLALGNLSGRHGSLQLEGRVEVPLRFDLLSEPLTPEEGPFYAYLRVPTGTDLGPLMHATDAFTRSGGRGEAELTISGPLLRPRYQGRLALDDLELVLRDTEEIYYAGRVRGVFTDDELILHEITGQTGLRGTFSGSGVVTFAGLELETWDIAFTADRLLVATIPDLRALVRTRNGRLTGVPIGPDRTLVPQFSGDFELIRGRYTGTFAGPPGAQDPTLGTITPDWLADLRITGPPRSFRIVNRNMELDLSGDVSLVRDADGMILSGTMDVDTGRLPVFNNTFRVVRGSLDFSREVGVVPSVDIDAETRVRLPSAVPGYSVVERLTVHATGPADAMTISYSSESGYPREAIERMLIGLSPYPDEQGDQAAFTSASIGAGLNLIEREIAREIGIFDTFEIDQIQRQQLGATGLDPLIGVGKYLGRDFYIKYAQGLNQNDRDLLIEYQINNHLLLQTEIRRRIDEYQGDATYNLDLMYRFEY